MPFEFTIPSDIDFENERIMIMTRPDDYRSDPDLVIHESLKNPTEELILSEEYLPYFCYHYGPDFCFIPQEYLIPGKTIKVYVYIQFGPCEFNMMVYKIQKNKEILQLNKEYLIFLEDSDNDFQETLSTYFSIKLPTLEENPDMDFFTISALHDNQLFGYTMNSELNDHDMHMMFSIGEDNDPQTNNQYIRQGLFVIENGIVFKIDKNSPYWKPGQVYNFVITSQDRDTIRILPRVGKQNEIINLNFDEFYEIHNKKIPEVLFGQQSMTYKIPNFNKLHDKEVVQDQKMSTIITLHQTFGTTNMFIDCNEQNIIQDFKSSSQFQVIDSGNKSLFISSEELETDCENLFIKVQSETHNSAFNLEVGFKSEDLQNDTVLAIRPHVSQFGYLKSDEMSAYIFELDKNKPSKVIITLSALQGNTDLYVRKCGKNDECIVDKKLMNNKYYNQDKQFIGFSEFVGNDVITFQHSSKTCYQEANNQQRPYCLYAIFVYNKQYNEDPTLNEDLKFKLTVELEGKTSYLKENQMVFGEAESGQYNYYIFDIGSYENIEEIAFIMTPVSGDPNIIVSRTIKQPSYQDSIYSFTWKDYISFQKSYWQDSEDLTTFYIAVHGFTATRYGITVQIKRKDNQLSLNPVVYSLINGIYMNSVFQEDDRYLFFEFPITKVNNLVQIQLVDMNLYFTQNLELYGQPITEDNKNTVSKDELLYPYFSNTSVMQIDRSIDKQSSTYYGYRLMVKRVNNDISQKYFFKILAQSLDEFIELQAGQERQLVIYKAQEYNMQKELYRAVMFKFKVNLDIDKEVHMSLNSEIYRNAFYAQFFSMKQNALIAFQNYKDDVSVERENNRYFMAFINFSEKQLKEMCQSQPRKSCEIQGLIKTFGDDSVFHDDFNVKANILLLKIDKNDVSNLIKLQKNKTIKIPVVTALKKSSSIMYQMYYQVTSLYESFFFDIQGSDIDGIISYHFYNGNLNSLDDLEKYKETLQEADKIQQTQKYMHYHKQIDPQMLKQECKNTEQCYLYIVVQSNAQNTFLNVQIGEDIMDISGQMNEFIKGNVGQDEYKYYKVQFDIESEFIKFNLNMINNGDANLIVYHSEDDDQFRPRDNIKDELCAEASNNAKQGNYICRKSINQNKADQIEFKPGKKGYYIIGVYGADSGDNLYDIHWSTNKLQELQKGISAQFKAPFKQPESYFFTVDKLSQNTITLLLSSDVQLIKNVKVSILVCDDPRSWLLSQSQFCTPELSEFVQKFQLESLSIDLNINEMCSKLQGPDCHIMFQFQSIVQNTDIELEGVLVEQIEGFQQMVLKPGKYIQGDIYQGEVHHFQLMFYDPENLKTHYLNINSIFGDINFKILPESLKIHNIMGQDNQLWTKIQSSHLKKEDYFKDSNQLSSVIVEVSGCEDEYGCEYGIGISVEGQAFELYPGAVYTGMLSTFDNQKFSTKIDENISKNKKYYFTLSTFVNYGNQNVDGLEVLVTITDKQNPQKISTKYYNIEQGQHSYLIEINQKMKEPLIDVILVQKENQNSVLVEYSLSLQNGSVEKLIIQEENRYSRDNSVQKQKSTKESPDIYILESNKAGYVLIEIEECKEKFTLIAENSYERLMTLQNKKFENPIRNQIILKVEPNKSQYIAVGIYGMSKGFKSDNKTSMSGLAGKLNRLKIQGTTGLYSIKSYFFDNEIQNQNELPQNVLIPGEKGELQYFIEDNNIIITWFDVEFQNVPENNKIMKKYTQGGSSVWARVTISNTSTGPHKRLQRCGYLPQKKIFQRRILEKIEKTENPKNKNNNKDSDKKQNILSKTYLLQNVDKNYSDQYMQGDIVFAGDYLYKIPLSEIQKQLGNNIKKFQVSVTMIIPPHTYENLPIDNYYDINIFYQSAYIDMPVLNGNSKQNNKNQNGNKFNSNGYDDGEQKPVIYYIQLILGIIFALALMAFIIRRVYLSRKKQQQDQQVVLGDISQIESIDQY